MPIHGYLGGVISATAPSVTTAGASGVFTLEEQLQASAQNNWPGYQITRSVRLRSSASAYFSRTLSTPTNSQKFTFSCWMKMGTVSIGTNEVIFDGGSTDCYFGINTSNQLYCAQGATNYLYTTQVFRDPSSWYHLLFVVDTTQATATNRMNYYVNGVQVTSFSTDNRSSITQNGNVGINTASAHAIGRQAPASSTYFDGYLTEINFIDGQALTPASFGVTDSVTGVWNPIRYSGTYGNNGFYLNFKDPTSTTTIGYDYSGNSNNWTANNISVTAGTTYDSMVDVPIGYGSDTGVGGELRGNYCTLNPLFSGGTLASANLDFSSSAATRTATSTFAIPTSGKWYWEVTVTAVGNSFQIGIGGQNSSTTNYLGSSSDAYSYSSNAVTYNNGSSSSYGATYTTNDVIGVAYDADAATLVFYKNNTSQGTAFSSLSGTFFPAVSYGSSSGSGSCVMNFGQRAFTYTAPTGFKALCTQNLPVPTILNGANYMAATTYSGTGATQTVSNAVNSISFQPDFAWFKCRSTATNNVLHDVLRGTGGLYRLFSDLTNAESTTGDGFSALASNGFTLDSTGSGGDVNTSGRTYVSWQWKGGGAGVSNTAGSITSTVSANTTAGFSILTYTGTGATATIGHGLGAVPSMMIMKKRSAAGAWKVYHTVLGNTKILEMNAVDGAQTSSTYWNNTSPTSTLITVGSNGDINASGETYVSYCWTAIAGYSAFISYTGNGSGDGPFVYCGFRPRYLMIKRYDASGDPWWVIDSTRSPYNQTILALRPNSSNAEDSGGNANFDFLANGFKARTSGGGNGNESGATYIVAAFAENPFNISRAR